MAYNTTLEGENKMIAERMLEDVVKIFNKCQIQYWLEGGTLLGIRREDRLLPWDDDLDISLMADQNSKLSNVIELLKHSNYRVRFRYFKKDDTPLKKGDLRMLKIRERRFFGMLKGPVCLDVFIKYPLNGDAYWEIANKKKKVPHKFYESFKEILFHDFKYSIPKQTDEYLTYRYGKWEIPIKDWDTTQDDKALH